MRHDHCDGDGAFIDPVTGLYNHGVFQILVDQEVRRARRYKDFFTLGLIEIEASPASGSPPGPDEEGRTMGAAAAVIRENLRDSDILARYADRVFGFVMRKSGIRTSRKAVDRIREIIKRAAGGRPTVNVGLAGFPLEASNREGVILKAHEALTAGKTAGKDLTHAFWREGRPAAGQRPRVLVVDDEPLNLKLMEAILRPFDCEVLKASDGPKALAAVNEQDVDLVLLDVMMPGMDGYQVCRLLKGHEATRIVPVVLVTALSDTEAKVRGIEAGADDFVSKPPNRVELTARVKSLLRIHTLNRNLVSTENVLFSMANAVESKDVYTQGHIMRVSEMAMVLGSRFDLPDGDIEALRMGGILHDIGKIGIPREILNKPGKLDPGEWEIIKTHPGTGYQICAPLGRALGPVLDIIRGHHEKLDGSGYPDGLAGDELSLLVRIMAAADIFDALITDRPYRRGIPLEKAFDILRSDAEQGKLDAEVVAQLIRSYRCAGGGVSPAAPE